MHTKFMFTLATALALCAGLAVAQAPDIKADLAAMEARAAASPELRRYMSQLRGSMEAGTNTPIDQVLEMIGGIRPDREGGLPFNYRLSGQAQSAMMRAQATAEILRNDLNGDWQVTRDELVATLSSGRNNNEGAAAFLLGDLDANNVLDTEEIKKAVETSLASWVRPSGRRDTLPQLFDFDDDGILTQSELDRGIAALRG